MNVFVCQAEFIRKLSKLRQIPLKVTKMIGCAQNRVRPEWSLGLFLRGGGQSRLLRGWSLRGGLQAPPFDGLELGHTRD